MTDYSKKPDSQIADQKESIATNQGFDQGNKKTAIIAIVVTVVVIALVALAAYFLLTAQPETTEQIRDVFIIFMALESLVIGLALVILIVQLATLINLLQNEIRPIINSTNETVNTLKGTAQFVSDHLAEPVIKLNQFMAMIRKLLNPKNR